MSNRRSLGDALSPEEEAFLKQQPAAAKPTTEPKIKVKAATPKPSQPPEEGRRQIEAQVPTIPQAGAAPLPGVGTINARIDPKITTALLRASVDRRIAGLVPSTQKDIIAVALTDWLAKNGYSI